MRKHENVKRRSRIAEVPYYYKNSKYTYISRMSHHQGSSYRSAADLYRPNSKLNYEGNGGGYGQGHAGDRGHGLRPSYNARTTQHGTGYRGNSSSDHLFRGSSSHYMPSNGSGAHINGYQQTRSLYMDTNSAASGPSTGFNKGGNHGYGNYSNRNNRYPQKQGFSNGSYEARQSQHGASNYRNQDNSNYQQNANRFQQKRSGDAYHQAYLQTQAESQLWMGDLDVNWTESDIMGIWNEVGESPINVKIIRDKMGKPQYSFVTFSSQDAVNKALKFNRSQIPGSPRFFKLNWASGGSQSDTRISVNRVRNSPDVGRGNSDYSLFVGDLSTEVTEPELFARFSQDYPGDVKQAKVMLDPSTGASKGFGFVRFTSVEAQQKALKSMNGVIIGQRPIRLGLANGGSQDSSASTTKKVNESHLAAVHIIQHQPALTPFTDPNNTIITIKGVISSISRDELIGHFLPFGHLVYCKVNHAIQAAQIKYVLRPSAEKALLFMHGFVINGSRLVLRWGREMVDSDGKLRCYTGKGSAYSAAEVAPTLYESLPTNVVFENLTKEQIFAIDFTEAIKRPSVEKINEAEEQRLEQRRNYLESAF